MADDNILGVMFDKSRVHISITSCESISCPRVATAVQIDWIFCSAENMFVLFLRWAIQYLKMGRL